MATKAAIRGSSEWESVKRNDRTIEIDSALGMRSRIAGILGSLIDCETFMTLYKNKYRIESARKPGWNYAANGAYFITICTRNRQHFFGTIDDGIMQLSAIGEIVADEWQKTAIVRPHVMLDEWVVMPNHFHAIVVIQNPNPDPFSRFPDDVETTRRVVSTGVSRLQPKSLGSIVGQFKSMCTKRIWAMEFCEFAWQSRFYDRIIPDLAALNRIRQYIKTNPERWKTDKFHR